MAYLRSEGDKKAAMVWKEAEAEAEQVRSMAGMKARQLREDFSRRLQRMAEGQREERLSEARDRSRRAILAADKELSDRMFSIAAGTLSALRTEGYEGTFASLVMEIPPHEWGRVRVNPEDISCARRNFPDAEIEADKGISGGMEVISKDGRIAIDNTFRKRLERAWEHVLPLIMADIEVRRTGAGD